MNKKIVIGIVVVGIAVLGIYASRDKTSEPSVSGTSYGNTSRYMQASSSYITTLAGVSYRAIASSSISTTSPASPNSAAVYEGSQSGRRDYLFFQAVSGDTNCSMEQGKAATMTDYSFKIGSTSPTFVQDVGVYNGAVFCISGSGSVFVVTEHNY